MCVELIMPFGKYHGQNITEVPEWYLKSIYEKEIVSMRKWKKIYKYIESNIIKTK